MRNRIKQISVLSIIVLSFFVFTGCESNKAYNLYETAESLWEEGRYEEALIRYAEVIENYPGSPYAPKSLYQTGMIQNLYLSQYKKAIDTLSKLIFLYPEFPKSLKAQKEIAAIYMDKLTDYKGAIFEYQKLLEAYETKEGVSEEEKGMVHYKIGLAYLQIKEFEQARVEFSELLTRYPSLSIAPEVYLSIGDSYFLEGNLKDAIETYKKVITVYPDSPVYLDARFKLAITIEETEELRKALEEYQKLLDSYPNKDILLLKINGIKERIEKKGGEG